MENQVQQNLTDLAHDAASIEKEGGGFMKPGEKRKRGRKSLPRDEKGNIVREGGPGGRGTTTQAGGGTSDVPPQINPIAEVLPLTRAVTSIYANVLVVYAEDERARPSLETGEHMSQSGAACLVQYFPDTFGKHAALILFSTIVGTTFFNAWVLRRENLAKLKAEKELKEKIHVVRPEMNN